MVTSVEVGDVMCGACHNGGVVDAHQVVEMASLKWLRSSRSLLPL